MPIKAKNFELVPILITEECDWNRSERVFALIRNDWQKENFEKSLYGQKYSYVFAAFRPAGPLPTKRRGGFDSLADAADAARREFVEWRAGNIERGTRMPRHMVWRTQYRRYRYLEYFSEEELIQRFNDVMSNLHTLTDDIKISLHPIGPLGEYWMIMFTHVLEEAVLRKHKYPAPFGYRVREAQIPKYDWPGLTDAVAQIQSLGLEPGKFLVKFGKAKHLRAMLKTGAIRIMPASFYDDPSLNPAIKDSELEVKFLSLPSEVQLQAIDGKTGESKGIIHPIGNIAYSFRAHSNYYAYCLTSALSLRLFGDFEADSCLILKSPGDFLVRIAEAFNNIHCGWELVAGSVDYYDPMNAEPEKLTAHFSKHFRFAYQQEFRIIWDSPEVQDKLDPVYLTLGNLEDICELIELPMAQAA